MTLVRITAPHFVAGVESADGVIVRAAPIVRYMLGWDGERFARYCKRKGWGYQRLDPPPELRELQEHPHPHRDE